MSRSEEFHNGTHTLEPGPNWGNKGEYHQGYCAKCSTTFTGHYSPQGVEDAHRDYVGTAEQAKARRDERDASQQRLAERYASPLWNPEKNRG